jgi:hypothetical protein
MECPIEDPMPSPTPLSYFEEVLSWIEPEQAEETECKMEAPDATT